jgi:hypothetical protein
MPEGIGINVLVFVFAVRGGKYVIAELTEADKARMDDLVTPAQMIDYLGIFEQISSVSNGSETRPPTGYRVTITVDADQAVMGVTIVAHFGDEWIGEVSMNAIDDIGKLQGAVDALTKRGPKPHWSKPR